MLLFYLLLSAPLVFSLSLPHRSTRLPHRTPCASPRMTQPVLLPPRTLGLLASRVLDTIGDAALLAQRVQEAPVDTDECLKAWGERGKPRLLVVGSGWAAHALVKIVDTSRWRVLVASPYHAFDPLVPSLLWPLNFSYPAGPHPIPSATHLPPLHSPTSSTYLNSSSTAPTRISICPRFDFTRIPCLSSPSPLHDSCDASCIPNHASSSLLHITAYPDPISPSNLTVDQSFNPLSPSLSHPRHFFTSLHLLSTVFLATPCICFFAQVHAFPALNQFMSNHPTLPRAHPTPTWLAGGVASELLRVHPDARCMLCGDCRVPLYHRANASLQPGRCIRRWIGREPRAARSRGASLTRGWGGAQPTLRRLCLRCRSQAQRHTRGGSGGALPLPQGSERASRI